MAVVTPQIQTPSSVAPQLRTGIGRVALQGGPPAHPFSASPARVPAVVPAITAVAIALAVAVQFDGAFAAGALPLVGGFAVLGIGLLLVPALTAHGSITAGEGGIVVQHDNRALVGRDRRLLPATGEHVIEASWKDVVALRRTPLEGATLILRGHRQNHTRLSLPGGFDAVAGGEARIPLRMLGERRVAVIDALRRSRPDLMVDDVHVEGASRLDRVVATAAAVAGCAAMLGYWVTVR